MTSTVPLVELIKPANVIRAANADFPILSMTMEHGLIDQHQKFKKRVASSNTSEYKVVSKNQLVVGFPIDEGVLAIQDKYDKAIVSPAYQIWDIAKPTLLDPTYLQTFLKSPVALHFYRSKLRSTTARRRSLSREDFLSFKMPLPALPDQKRVVATLEKASKIRREQEHAASLVDEFLRAAFTEMFGDPISNSKNLKIAPIRTLGRVVTGNTPPRKDADNFGPGIEWIKSDNLNSPNHFVTGAEETLTEKGRSIARIVPAGSTLVTCIAGSPNSIGNAALADREVAFNQQINAVVPNPNVDPFFLYCHFLVGKRLVQNASTNSMKGLVSKGKFQEIGFLNPTPDKQKEFGRLFNQLIKTTEHFQKGLLESDVLFRCLYQRAFRGEL